MTLTETELIDRLSRAIARQEGFFDKKKLPTVAQRCHNPGNLTHWKDWDGHPYPTANGYVMFPDEATGWRALRVQCRINALKRRLTFREFCAGKPGVFPGFCPDDDDPDNLLRKNDPLMYAQRVLVLVTSTEADNYDIDTPIVSLVVDGGVNERAA